jgi:hypothetical protein
MPQPICYSAFLHGRSPTTVATVAFGRLKARSYVASATGAARSERDRPRQVQRVTESYVVADAQDRSVITADRSFE